MASKQRSRAPRKARAPNPLADLGIFNIPDVDSLGNLDDDDSDVDESMLESELEAILSGKVSGGSKPKKPAKPPVDIERLAAECLKDVEDDDEDDESLLQDKDLLNELQGLACDGGPEEDPIPEEMHTDEPPLVEIDTPVPERPSRPAPSPPSQNKPVSVVTVLQERLQLYNEAVAAAKESGNSSKVRRYGRAVKTLEGLIKDAKAGKAVNEEDIPPIVSIPKKGSSEENKRSEFNSGEPLPPPLPPKGKSEALSPPASDTHVPPKGEEDDATVKNLVFRRDQYKVAALQSKRAGDKDTALQYVKIAKTFDAVIAALRNDEPVDLSNLPPPPPTFQSEQVTFVGKGDAPGKEENKNQTSSMEAAALSAASEPEDPAIFDAPPAPTSILEALQQRLEKYNSTKAAAEAEGNSSKVRRLQRIIKSYETAIKDYKAGKNINFEELPTPPGFAPIPVSPNQDSKPSPSTDPGQEQLKPKVPKPSVSPNQKQTQPQQVPNKAPVPQKPKVQRANTSTYDKQLEFLLERQKLFRQAALDAKRNGDLQQAKEYLRQSKGFDSMIEATKCGLPIDTSSIPTPPQLESDFVIVDVSDCTENPEGSPAELLETLENDLTNQIQICNRNKEHFLRLGDVSSASKFERLGLESKKDLTVIRHLKKIGETVPKFHYETRLFSMVQCNTDLGDDEVVVTVERGINLPGKADDLDSYVKIDFPIPSDAPQKAKTHTMKDTNNPIFQEEFKFEINRKSRAQLRQFKRAILKLEVWSRGGFLRSDALLGTASIKLVDLESKCTLHECISLMDGRKACGGKLEVKVRLRDPLLVKQVEEVKEKWLVIES